ncbi:hybrid sensor histidine kinase/response regulator [Gloeobacter violaceus]|uniref:Circadian input-output histidine kinase CikA n=1 Tax=Gloeobacter violaceus (strain ATCC 29082 / PCC 7421) TaxID=251221 RepID=Q7NMY1_GLOVI|nr:response regulator [Gloeobacter violaceus]BAC88575.1 two-component hybrid sensor and regulator [Gloeobacter violaceus PCC 7421]
MPAPGTAEPVTILLVDDRFENLLALEAVLGELGQNLVKARSGPEALRHLLRQDFAVILLDVQMPGMDGFETAQLIRQRERSRHTPIIFLTAYSANDSLIFKGYALGAVDYLLKPINPSILISKVVVFIDLFRKSAEIERQAGALVAVNRQLRSSEQRLQDFLDNASDLIEIVSPEGRLLYVNRTWRETLAYPADDLEKMTCFDVVAPADRPLLAEALERVQQSQRSERLEVAFLAMGGREIAVEGSLNCQFDKGVPQAIRCIFRDITERRQAEQVRVEILREQVARQQAEEASRMKDEFLAMVSHELRTPLNSILGWAQLLRARRIDEKAATGALESIERNARMQNRLIEDLLDISRVVTGQMRLELQPLELSGVIASAVEAVQPAAAVKQIQLRCRIDAAVGPVLGDVDRLHQIAWNLLANAVKFTPQGGTVEVDLAQGEIHAQLVVRDNGIGISPAFLDQIFERFRQADSTSTRVHGGLGLGLSIVRHLVELHGGTAAAESAGKGQGATFTVRLPLLADGTPIQDEGKLVQANGRTEALTELVQWLAGLRVLVVDDEVDAREFVATALGEYGVQVVTVGSVREALSALAAQKTDVLVSDIGMPGEDGYALIRELRSRGNTLPAIAFTAYARGEDLKDALQAGFQCHVPKPVEIAQLVSAIASLSRNRKAT